MFHESGSDEQMGDDLPTVEVPTSPPGLTVAGALGSPVLVQTPLVLLLTLNCKFHIFAEFFFLLESLVSLSVFYFHIMLSIM